jgi:hypothetical protein
MKKNIETSEDPSPLFLASFRRLDAIKWEALTEKDVTECDNIGRTLLHHCAKEGYWGHLPPKFTDKKYWKPTFDGTTIAMNAMVSKDPSWLDESELSESKLTSKNKLGESLLSLATANGNLDQIPKESLTKKVLSTKHQGLNSYIHLIAENKSLGHLPKELLTEELLSLRGDKGKSVYHTLAENGDIWLIPKKLLTPESLLLKDDENRTPLSILIAKEDPIEILPKKLLTKEFFFREENGQQALIHSWVNGKYWMLIPKDFITKETLKSQGKGTLLKSILFQYGRGAVWYTKGSVSVQAMTELTKKAIEVGDLKELEQISQEWSTLEKGDTYPNGIKKVSALIRDELTKRKMFDKLSKQERDLEI